MANNNLTPEQVERLHADNLIDRAYHIREEYARILDERKANRDALRAVVRSNMLADNPDFEREVNELYPPRAKGESEAAAELAVVGADGE